MSGNLTFDRDGSDVEYKPGERMAVSVGEDGVIRAHNLGQQPEGFDRDGYAVVKRRGINWAALAVGVFVILVWAVVGLVITKVWVG